MKLTDDAKNMIRVLQRSPKDSDGWAKVSVPVWPLLECVPADLMERKGDSQNGGRCRLTPNGELVALYTL